MGTSGSSTHTEAFTVTKIGVAVGIGVEVAVGGGVADGSWLVAVVVAFGNVLGPQAPKTSANRMDKIEMRKLTSFIEKLWVD